MTSGGQCVVTSGVDLKLQLFVNNLDIPTLEVSVAYVCVIECVCDAMTDLLTPQQSVIEHHILKSLAMNSSLKSFSPHLICDVGVIYRQ